MKYRQLYFYLEKCRTVEFNGFEIDKLSALLPAFRATFQDTPGNSVQRRADPTEALIELLDWDAYKIALEAEPGYNCN